ncbi:hypothetical protein PLESTB_000373200 [Pleodorina starrii]|uniref:Peptidase M48 domain-containing protein n=1 Tax=Pleodorina starrii TaxID=330485 RepID=A0A9W6EZ96_9CHLO|nr:hypothetical protein PLESTM_000021700 [Pleodorina starrii]GLC50384.1 hypothetical protein PLESTB_000373200 [Pleodorina starrii]GLC64235.1 hypothetical protein PLESTF_000139500 [Pleodorina starrii]
MRLGFRLVHCRCRLVAPARPGPYRRKPPRPVCALSGQAAAPRQAADKQAASAWPNITPVVKEKVSMFEGLEGDDFRHPLDQQNTSMLRSVPGLEVVAKNFMGPVAEQVLLLENISTSIKIGPDQLPSVHKLLVEAARILQMEAPELYVRQHPVPNAYTLAIAGHKPFIVIHTALLELLTPYELQAVLAHELGHLKCDHGLWLTVANVLASGTVSVLPVVTGMVQEALMRWLRAAELTCDRAALLVAQDPKVVISALMKLAGGSPSFASELNVDAFLQQSRSYEEATNSLLGWYLRNAQTAALSHPLPVMRAREIDRWSQSTQYKGLLSKNRTHRVQFMTAPPPPQQQLQQLQQQQQQLAQQQQQQQLLQTPYQGAGGVGGSGGGPGAHGGSGGAAAGVPGQVYEMLRPAVPLHATASSGQGADPGSSPSATRGGSGGGGGGGGAGSRSTSAAGAGSAATTTAGSGSASGGFGQWIGWGPKARR